VPFREPLSQERRCILLRLEEAPKGFLAQFSYVNCLPAAHEQEYAMVR